MPPVCCLGRASLYLRVVSQLREQFRIKLHIELSSLTLCGPRRRWAKRRSNHSAPVIRSGVRAVAAPSTDQARIAPQARGRESSLSLCRFGHQGGGPTDLVKPRRISVCHRSWTASPPRTCGGLESGKSLRLCQFLEFSTVWVWSLQETKSRLPHPRDDFGCATYVGHHHRIRACEELEGSEGERFDGV
jgi:hypothetical protein